MAHNRTPMADVIDDDTFWVGTPELIAERMLERKALGFHTFLAELAAPFDDETIERWIGEVLPMVDRPSVALRRRVRGGSSVGPGPRTGSPFFQPARPRRWTVSPKGAQIGGPDARIHR